MKTIDELKAAAAVVRDATVEKENTALRVGQLLVDAIETLSHLTSENIKGYVAIGNTAELPADPTAEQRMKGYLLGTVLYVYVGTGGDTLDGKYQSADLKGEKGDKGDSGVHLDDVQIADDLATDDAAKVLSARQGKVLGDALRSDATLEGTLVAGKNIVRDPSTSRGDLSNTTVLALKIYTGLTPGEHLFITYEGTDSTTTAQAAGWYNTEELSEMNKDTFMAVDGLNMYTKTATGNTYEVVVPSTHTTLVVCFYNGRVDVSVRGKGIVGSRLNEMESDIDDLHEEILDVKSELGDMKIWEERVLSADETLAGYRIARTTYALTDDYPTLFSVQGYHVSPGDRIRIVNTSDKGQSNVTLVYAFYSSESLVNGLGEPVPTGTDAVAMPEENIHRWNGTQAVFDDTVVVPAGAHLLAVTLVTTLSSNPVVYKQVPVSVTDKIAELESMLATSKMAVSRQGENVYVAYNNGDGVELVYWFGRVHTTSNNTLGLRQVGYRKVTRATPLADSSAFTVLCHQNGSDMIGPVNIDNTFIGGNHDVNGTATATNESWSIEADGESVSSGDSRPCFSVKVTAVNKVSHPTWGDVYEEIIVMTAEENRIKVNVTHNYKYSGGVGRTINYYYGMQSMFGSRSTTQLLTPDGKFTQLIAESSSSPASKGFKKGDYPSFNRFVQRNPDGWCQSAWLDPSVGLGDHSWISDTDGIFVDGSAAKFYHKVISNKVITSGMTYQWEGVYRWEQDKGVSIADDLANAH